MCLYEYCLQVEPLSGAKGSNEMGRRRRVIQVQLKYIELMRGFRLTVISFILVAQGIGMTNLGNTMHWQVMLNVSRRRDAEETAASATRPRGMEGCPHSIDLLCC